jgi:transposase
MWTATDLRHKREGLRVAGDLTDAEWAVLEPLLPPRRKSGRPPAWPMREIINAIFYLLRGGIPWRMLLPYFPSHQTVYGWFAMLRDGGVWQTINHHLVLLDHERAGREASLSAAVIDSQSTEATEAGGVRGYDAGKRAPLGQSYASMQSASRRTPRSRKSLHLLFILRNTCDRSPRGRRLPMKYFGGCDDGPARYNIRFGRPGHPPPHDACGFRRRLVRIADSLGVGAAGKRCRSCGVSRHVSHYRGQTGAEPRIGAAPLRSTGRG